MATDNKVKPIKKTIHKNGKAFISLSEPVEHGTETISALEIKQPKAKHLRSMPLEPNTGDLLDLAARLAGQPPSVIDELGMSDMTEVLTVVGDFIEGGQGIGKKQ